MKPNKIAIAVATLGIAGAFAYAQRDSLDAHAATGPVAGPAAAGARPAPASPAYRPEQRRALFGELHLHTALSFDAWAYGTKLLPDDAYRFGRGETVMVPATQVAHEQGIAGQEMVPAKRAWPLDFMAVTDHAEELGVLAQLDQPGNEFARSEEGRKILADPAAVVSMRALARRENKPMPAALVDPKVGADSWEMTKRAANANNRPGSFTTFIAYEWSSMPTGNNQHRNVIFNADDSPAPFSAADSTDPEDLWTYLERARANGIEVLAIPHNANVSGGTMYDWNNSKGRPIDEVYAQRRALNEPLTEIVQSKGQSDTVPVLSPTDEFANFEIFDHLLGRPNIKSEPNGSFVRQAYGRGLVIGARIGVNPYKYGVVGGSDTHNALSASDETAFAGGPYGIDPATMTPGGDAARRALGTLPSKPKANVTNEERAGRGEGQGRPKGTPPAPLFTTEIERSSPGLTGVWAEENTRNAIFAALKRKETFATSGTRIRVRAFAGWDFNAGMLKRPDWVAKAYAGGVPMGGDLPRRPAQAKAPGFFVEAMKDATGANLDRVQVIKIWLDRGEYKEKIFDVALSGGRKVDPATGKAPAVGNTVDLDTARTDNRIGSPTFTTFWRDPEFDAGQAAVYYVRVLEIPTARWSTHLAVKNKMPIPTLRPATIQERAWASPIWYTPPKG